MAHNLTYTVSPDNLVRDETGVPDDMMVHTEAANDIHNQWVAEGKITGTSQTEPDENDVYEQTITFLDSATCDAYLAAMEAIGEAEKSGASRTNQRREDV